MVKVFAHPDRLDEFTPENALQHIEDLHHHIKGCRKDKDVIYTNNSLIVVIEKHMYYDTTNTFLWIFQRDKISVINLSS